jgi:hypothetical protein
MKASLSVPRHARSMLLELATFVRSRLARFELIEVLSIVDLDKKDLLDKKDPMTLSKWPKFMISRH